MYFRGSNSLFTTQYLLALKPKLETRFQIGNHSGLGLENDAGTSWKLRGGHAEFWMVVVVVLLLVILLVNHKRQLTSQWSIALAAAPEKRSHAEHVNIKNKTTTSDTISASNSSSTSVAIGTSASTSISIHTSMSY